MTKIFKQLGRHWAACLAVVALLIVQAYCDLSLPDYTSKIVDTGIQQGGIESPVPDTVRSTTLQALELLMSEDDAALADEAYTDPDADGMRTLNPDADTAALENAFTTPDVVLYMAAAKNAATAAGTTDTVVPTAYDLDAVATQLTAASQAPGAREMLQSQLTDVSPSWTRPSPTACPARPCCSSRWNMTLRALPMTCKCPICCARAVRCWL